MSELLIIDDDHAISRTLELHYSQLGYHVRTGHSLEEARQHIQEICPDAMILDLKLPDGEGIELLKELAGKPPLPPVIMLTGHQDLEYAIEAMRAGAFDYLLKPPDIDQLDMLVRKGVEQSRSKIADSSFNGVQSGSGIVGSSLAMIQLHKQIGLASRSRATVLIEGESGTGKELVAKAIHQYSENSGPFVAVNCGAIVPGLIESEFFGHRRGAFTGASDDRKGRFEEAGEGTIFLDEIGDLRLDMQVKLLRVLQEKVFTRVGGGKSVSLQARVIAATNRDLERLVRAGEFRGDLFFRLSPLRIVVPPLRERLSDIPELVTNLIGRHGVEAGGRVVAVSNKDIKLLQGYNWPGNVRELENVILQSLIQTPGEVLNLVELPLIRQRTDSKGLEGRSLADIERSYIATVLERVGWNFGRACEILEISRPTLRKKIVDYGITKGGGESGHDFE